MSKIILAFSGKKGAGKGSLCSFVEANAHCLFPAVEKLKYGQLIGDGVEVRQFAFAQPVKELLQRYLGISGALLYGTDEDKQTLTEYCWEKLPHYLPGVHPRGRLSVRQLMQEVGTGIFRRMKDSVWADCLVREMAESSAAVCLVEDVRYPNELEAIHSAGGKVIRLTRAPYKDSHSSETDLDPLNFNWSNFDYVIDNKSMSLEEQNRACVLALRAMGLSPWG